MRWFWRHFRGHYFVALGVVAVGFVSVGILAPLATLFTHVWRLSPAEGAIFAFTFFLILAGSAAMSIVTSRSVRVPIEAWIAGDESDPEQVRDVALVAAQRLAQRSMLLAVPLGVFVAGPVINRYAHMGWRGFIVIEFVLVAAEFVSMFLVGVGTTLLARPLLDEVGAHITGNAAPLMNAWSLRLRFGSGVLATGFTAGLGAGGISYLFSSSLETAFVATCITSVLMAIYCTTLFEIGVIQPTLEPLSDLIHAITRVRQGDFSQRLSVVSTDEFGDIAVAFNDMMTGLQQRTALQSAFGSYVDPALATRLLNQDSSIFDGEAVKATIFFADVRGFTTYADQVTPEKAVARLNRLFDILVPAIRDAGGHPNRYTGDGVLAVFGTPEPLVNHAECAIEAALAIQRGIREVFGEGLHMGIGINTGRVIAGTIGGGGKLDFTVIGDAVNIASRVEEMTKETGDCILVTQATVDACVDAPTSLLPRGPQPVRGKSTSVVVYAVVPAA